MDILSLPCERFVYFEHDLFRSHSTFLSIKLYQKFSGGHGLGFLKFGSEPQHIT